MATYNITIILPFFRKISGGYKIVCEYANRLAKKGHFVEIVLDCSDFIYNSRKYKLIPKSIKYAICLYYLTKIKKWYSVSKLVTIRCARKVNENTVNDGDVIIATAVSTAKEVAKLSNNKGKKIYFIQGYEAWGGWSEYQVNETYKLGMKNIVIAKWLQDKVSRAGAESVILKNAIDTNVFYVKKNIDTRNKYNIAMMYRLEEVKGAKYGIKALGILKKKYPKLNAILFGPVSRPKLLPSWIKYEKNVNEKRLNEIYNEASIYLYPAIKEGFGLTGAEAMACGCAYVSSDYGGVHEYTINGRNVLLSLPRDVNGLVKNVSYLIENDIERINIAKAGVEDIKTLDWKNNIEKLEEIMESL